MGKTREKNCVEDERGNRKNNSVNIKITKIWVFFFEQKSKQALKNLAPWEKPQEPSRGKCWRLISI